MGRLFTLDEAVRGSLLGFAIGDAMGATTEFMTSDEIKSKYGVVRDLLGGGWLNLEAGQVTDDTQMMTCVFDAIQQGGDQKEVLGNICKQFREWADSNPPDIGGACSRAIYGTDSLDPEVWMQANVRRQGYQGHLDYGNGGLMRCLVPCLLNNTDLAMRQSALTHTNSLCDLMVDSYSHTLELALHGLKPEVMVHYEPTGHVVNTERNAEFWFVTSSSFEDALVRAVNDGGDAAQQYKRGKTTKYNT